MTKHQIIGQVSYLDTICNVLVTQQEEQDFSVLQLFEAEDGELFSTASIQIPDTQLPSGHVFIKNWRDNEGILDCLLDAGIVRNTYYKATPIGLVPVAQVLPMEVA